MISRQLVIYNEYLFLQRKVVSSPHWTYQKKDNFVRIYLKEEELHVYDNMQDKFLCKYLIIWK